jgi:hypothetical protein
MLQAALNEMIASTTETDLHWYQLHTPDRSSTLVPLPLLSSPLLSSYPISSPFSRTEAKELQQTKVRPLSLIILLSSHIHPFHLIIFVLVLGLVVVVVLLLLLLGRHCRRVRPRRWKWCSRGRQDKQSQLGDVGKLGGGWLDGLDWLLLLSVSCAQSSESLDERTGKEKRKEGELTGGGATRDRCCC